MENQPNDGNPADNGKKKLRWKEFFSLGEVGNYFFRGKNDQRPSNVNIRIMHGINRIAIVVFLAGIMYLILKRFL